MGIIVAEEWFRTILVPVNGHQIVVSDIRGVVSDTSSIIPSDIKVGDIVKLPVTIKLDVNSHIEFVSGDGVVVKLHWTETNRDNVFIISDLVSVYNADYLFGRSD